MKSIFNFQLMDEEADTITELQRDIELQLERDSKKKKRGKIY